MKTPLRRSAPVIAAAIALLGTAIAGPAQAVPGDGKGEVVVKLVDDKGSPTPGLLYILEKGSTALQSEIPTSAMTSQVSGSLDAGRYGVLAMSPWGGITCLGIDPCSYLRFMGGDEATSAVSGAFDIADAETPVVATLKNPAPGRITGNRAIGDRLTLTWSAGMQQMAVLYGTSATLYAPTVTWQRDGKPVATGASYVVRTADAGHRISALLSYPATSFWSYAPGAEQVPNYAVPGVVATKRATRTTADLFRKSITQGRGTGMMVDVTSAKQAATEGKVTVRVGPWKTTRAIRNGTARVALPKTLKPGRYPVTVSYLGSATYLPSKATKQTLTVTKK